MSFISVKERERGRGESIHVFVLTGPYSFFPDSDLSFSKRSLSPFCIDSIALTLSSGGPACRHAVVF